jgi:YebC/PmpR family DNA-binding regulatory protein
MAGHSKWAGIKHKKAIVDARRGKLFTKLARAITVAAKEGGGDAEGNPALALAVQKARDASMPKDNIERAIAKGTGEGADADALEAVMYEGYGPGGVAILVEALTDNRNRTGSEIRHAFNKHGGNLGEPGSVAYLFDKKGVVVVDGERYTEDDLMPAVDAGAEDIVLDDDVFEVITEPSDLAAVHAALVEAGIEVADAEVMQRPKTRVPLDEDGATKVMRLIDTLDDLDDTDTVHANFDVPAEIMERVAG